MYVLLILYLLMYMLRTDAVNLFPNYTRGIITSANWRGCCYLFSENGNRDLNIK